MDFLLHHAKGFGSLFYLVNPDESMFEKIGDLPKPTWTARAFPYFLSLMFLEHVILKLKGKSGIRLNDGITSLSTGMMMLLKEMILKGVLYWFYIHVYDNYRIYALPWDSIWTWIIAALATDLGYYWVHRAAHEINILWAGHQVHHSSEEYNLSTALRQSITQYFGSWPFYIPMAFFVPPTHMMVHAQFNLLYQFWIHTEVVQDLGPLEYILNTAKHHRVHHGSNRYCLDKNYAGVLIIWDRIFGTFEWEREDEKIVYGLVDQPQFLNPLRHQLFYYKKIWEKAESMDNWSDKVSAFLKGPGWFPGTGRLGDEMQVPEVQDRKKYNPPISSWMKFYAFLHFFIIFLAFNDLARLNMVMSQTMVLSLSGFFIWTLTNLGMLFDNNFLCWPNELARGLTFIAIYSWMGAWTDFVVPAKILFVVYGATSFIAASIIIARLTSGMARSKKTE